MFLCLVGNVQGFTQLPPGINIDQHSTVAARVYNLHRYAVFIDVRKQRRDYTRGSCVIDCLHGKLLVAVIVIVVFVMLVRFGTFRPIARITTNTL